MVALLVDLPTITWPDPDRVPDLYPAPRPVGPQLSRRVGPQAGLSAPARAEPNRAATRPSRAVLRRRRMVAAGLVGVVMLLSWIGLQAALGRIGGGPLATTDAPGGWQTAATRVWTVQPGDTLWSIAMSVDPHGDVRPLVDRLAAEVHGAALYPGETIPIP